MNNEELTNQKKIRKPNRRRIITELLIYVIIILLCVFVIPEYFVQRTIVKGTSMESTLHNNENLLVDKLSYNFTNPDRFDIVVFYPNGEESSEYYVKRIIGLPGETIQIIDSNIYINGFILDEQYGKDPIIYSGIAKNPLTLSDDEYFVLGDNRLSSFDSRYSDIGPVSRDKIKGKVLLRILPFSKFGPVK